ncbi:hypothetical protein PIB30_042274 [Stylosanthes scabra]|uniref:Uncharacterized protein n=1 Tax=Stylosanthes scabra TaxID=79078 RepID=A0ABU6UIC5_9FABA|nr:hypothetical protein [Stylosanthes scabra]
MEKPNEHYCHVFFSFYMRGISVLQPLYWSFTNLGVSMRQGGGASLPHSFKPFIIRTNPNGASHTPTGHSHRPTPRPTAHGPPCNPTFPPIPSRDVADTEGDTTPRLASSPRQLFIVSSRRQVSPSHAASASPRLRHVSTGLKLVAAPLLRFVVTPNLVEVVLIPPHAR